MNIAVNNVEEKAVHSWSRISSAGQKALEEALRVFNPMSKDLSDTETQLVAFLQGLREEGYQPTILRSKDVYGYSSCTADTPGQTEESIQHSSGAAMAPSSADALAIPTATPTRMAAPLAGISVSSSTVSPKPVSKGSSTNLLLNSLKQTRSGTSKAPAMAFPANMYPDVYPAVRLSVVLEALVPLKTAAPCLESKYKPGQLGLSPSDHRLHKASSASARTAKVMSGPLDPKGCKHFAKKVPDSSSLAAGLLKGPKGGVLQESNACKASGVLNGRITGSSSQSISGGPPAKASKVKAREVPGGRTEWRESSGPTETTGQKRKRALEPRDTPQKATANAMPAPHKADRAPSAWNLLKFRVIKVDSSSSDDEVRRRAQQILRVNLSPVIRIQPLSHAHSVP